VAALALAWSKLPKTKPAFNKPTLSRGFTLIELLVVITIISILAAILFPVFSQAKAAAKKTVALSNLKQINTAFQLYSNDYDGCYMRWQGV
ncbi:type II secretion system protein, partial [Klebsiella pneumoniae]|uniref:type II secretion system protein n=1 Tax=Klebsiella pneumoniae TaxID=573 RepID=UPI003853AC2B